MTLDEIAHLRELAERRGYRLTRRRSHPLSIRIDRDLFEECRTMLMIERGRMPAHTRNIAPHGMWPDLIERLLTTWVTQQKAQLQSQPFKEPDK